jgi:hypothetical protein
MVTNDDARYCGKLVVILKGSESNANAIYFYRDEHYIIPGMLEYTDDTEIPIFHAYWGDDLAEEIKYPLIIERFTC